MRLIVIILIGVGICFRFVNLDHKVYWYDEAITSLRSAGYTEAEVVQQFPEPALVSAADLLRYQQPALDRGVESTLQSLIVEDPHHPPLYYVLSHFWMRWVGSSVAAMRALSVLLSLLALPAMYWLCWELFVATGVFRSRREFEVSNQQERLMTTAATSGRRKPDLVRQSPDIDSGAEQVPSRSLTNKLQGQSNLVCWIAVALLAVSPFQILYAQEARQYGLWAATILLATASLLRAIRCKTVMSWAIYALTLALSLYTFLFSGLMAIAHGVYVVLLSKFRPSYTLVAYLLAATAGAIFFLPWALAIAGNLEQAEMATDWTGYERQWTELVIRWVGLLGRLFYDTNTEGSIHRLIRVSCVLLIGIAFYQLCRRTPRSVWLLVVTLTAVPAGALILPDLLTGGMRSTVARYLFPTWLGVEIAVAYLLAAKLGRKGTARSQRLWRWIAIAVFSVSILSGVTIAQTQLWWTKTHGQETPVVAQTINQANRPLLLSDARTGELLSLVQHLNANVDLWVQPYCYMCRFQIPEQINSAILRFPEGYREVFLFHSRAAVEWQRSLQQQRDRFEAMLPSGVLWKLR